MFILKLILAFVLGFVATFALLISVSRIIGEFFDFVTHDEGFMYLEPIYKIKTPILIIGGLILGGVSFYIFSNL